MKSRAQGFTLVELIVVVALVAILAALAAPSFRGVLASQRVKAAASDLGNSLSYARSEAIKRNTTVSVVSASGGWASGWTVSVGTVANAAAANASNTVNVLNGFSDLSFTCYSGGSVVACGSNVVFGANGRAVSAQKFQIGSSTVSGVTTRCVSIDLSGLPNTKVGVCT